MFSLPISDDESERNRTKKRDLILLPTPEKYFFHIHRILATTYLYRKPNWFMTQYRARSFETGEEVQQQLKIMPLCWNSSDTKEKKLRGERRICDNNNLSTTASETTHRVVDSVLIGVLDVTELDPDECGVELLDDPTALRIPDDSMMMIWDTIIICSSPFHQPQYVAMN